MIKTKDKKPIFRLAAMLYKDENYSTSIENTIKKIVESLFLEDNCRKTIYEILEECELRYGLAFDEEEIEKVVYKNLDKFEVKREGLSNIEGICLTDKRTHSLQANNAIDIEQYINKYIKNELDDEKKDIAKEVLYRFIYETFSSNLLNYQFFLNKNDSEKKMKINMNHKEFNENEKEIINGFLNFDDFEKDKAIFNIVSLSLEYCILTGDCKQVYTQGIRNKVFYLDSNIIYRAIGINGDARKTLTYKFLKKCKQSNIEFRIFKHSDEEFKGSIEHNTKKLSKEISDCGKVNYNLFNKYYKQHDIYSFYYEWCCGRTNKDIRSFRAQINALYSQFLEDLNVKTDHIKYFEEDNEELANLIPSIRSIKSNFNEEKADITIEYDAKNILAMKVLRKKHRELNNKLLETKYYFITTDQILQEWDYKNNKHMTPLVLLPSQWLAIMLRLVGRTPDDYKSFVSFLNLGQNKETITNENLHAVLRGISELIEDIDTQEKYANEIIQLEVNNIIFEENPSEIYEKTTEYVKNDLEESLRLEREEHNIAKEELASAHTAFDNTQHDKEQDVLKIKEVSEERDSYRKQLIEERVKSKMTKWSRYGCLFILGVAIILIWISLHFFFINSKYNFLHRFLFPYIDDLTQYARELFSYFDVIICFTLLSFFIKQSHGRLYTKSKKYTKKARKVKESISEDIVDQ